MNAGTKLGIIGLAITTVLTITFGVLELKRDRRMHQEDINLIVEGVRAKTKQPKNTGTKPESEVK